MLADYGRDHSVSTQINSSQLSRYNYIHTTLHI